MIRLVDLPTLKPASSLTTTLLRWNNWWWPTEKVCCWNRDDSRLLNRHGSAASLCGKAQPFRSGLIDYAATRLRRSRITIQDETESRRLYAQGTAKPQMINQRQLIVENCLV